MKESVFAFLDTAGIRYSVTEHPAVYTMEEMAHYDLDKLGPIPKNLFVRDGKGKQHFLICAAKDTAIDLKELGEKLQVKKLSFASAQRLETHLGVSAGCVSPLGVINDEAHCVVVILDEMLRGLPRLGVHPNVNTATLWLSFEDLVKALETAGNEVRILKL